MKLFVWDDGLLGTSEGNFVAELHSVYPDHVNVKTKDGKIHQYQNGISIDEMYCRKGHKIKEDWIGSESKYVSDGYVCACEGCDEDMYLFEVLGNKTIKEIE